MFYEEMQISIYWIFFHIWCHTMMMGVDTWHLFISREILFISFSWLKMCSAKFSVHKIVFLTFILFFRQDISTTVSTSILHHVQYISKNFLKNIDLVLCICHQFLYVNECPLYWFHCLLLEEEGLFPQP